MWTKLWRMENSMKLARTGRLLSLRIPLSSATAIITARSQYSKGKQPARQKTVSKIVVPRLQTNLRQLVQTQIYCRQGREANQSRKLFRKDQDRDRDSGAAAGHQASQDGMVAEEVTTVGALEVAHPHGSFAIENEVTGSRLRRAPCKRTFTSNVEFRFW